MTENTDNVKVDPIGAPEFDADKAAVAAARQAKQAKEAKEKYRQEQVKKQQQEIEGIAALVKKCSQLVAEIVRDGTQKDLVDVYNRNHNWVASVLTKEHKKLRPAVWAAMYQGSWAVGLESSNSHERLNAILEYLVSQGRLEKMAGDLEDGMFSNELREQAEKWGDFKQFNICYKFPATACLSEDQKTFLKKDINRIKSKIFRHFCKTVWPQRDAAMRAKATIDHRQLRRGVPGKCYLMPPGHFFEAKDGRRIWREGGSLLVSSNGQYLWIQDLGEVSNERVRQDNKPFAFGNFELSFSGGIKRQVALYLTQLEDSFAPTYTGTVYNAKQRLYYHRIRQGIRRMYDMEREEERKKAAPQPVNQPPVPQAPPAEPPAEEPPAQPTTTPKATPAKKPRKPRAKKSTNKADEAKVDPAVAQATGA